MYFKDLPKDIQAGIFQLTKDEQFQKRFATDKVLDEIEQMKFNRAQELKILQLLTMNKVQINQRWVKGITPVMWSNLWIMNNAFISNTQKLSEIDIDVFMYMLENDVELFDPVIVLDRSFNYCVKNNISLETATNIILVSIKLAFKPLNLFPKINKTPNNLLYDGDWLTSLITKVNAVTGYSPEKIMNDLSMTAVCFYFAQFARMNGNDAIYQRTPEQLLKLQDERCCELIVERLVENHVISPEMKNQIFKKISSVPDTK